MLAAVVAVLGTAACLGDDDQEGIGTAASVTVPSTTTEPVVEEMQVMLFAPDDGGPLLIVAECDGGAAYECHLAGQIVTSD